jgi:dienelactone hydrolase
MNKSIIGIIFALIVAIVCTKQEKSLALPIPTGNFAIGTTTYHLIDNTRQDRHNSSPRELMVQVWYPAQVTGKEPRVAYASPEAIKIIKEDLSKATQAPLEKLSHLDTLKAHAISVNPISSAQQTYPVIIFSPGFGSPVALYTTLLEELASHGYIVMGINYPYVTNPVVFPDGNIIKQASEPREKQQRDESRALERKTWIADIQFVIDQCEKINAQDTNNILTNKLDMNHIGVFGHSFGGTVSVEVCQIDKRCTAGVDIEGKLSGNLSILTKPFLFIVAPHEEEILKPVKDLLNDKTTPIYYAEIKEANHGSFGDFYLIAPWKELPKLDPIKGIEITRALVVNFFDMYLKGKKSTFLTDSINQYPEIMLNTSMISSE